jgi:uncharacterized protein (TIGR02996 family)
VTTEDDFNAALDADPEDWQTRLVFADWLQERGDPRAEGYRALGILRMAPLSSDYSGVFQKRLRHWRWVYHWDNNDRWVKMRERQEAGDAHVLPAVWSARANRTGSALDLGGAVRREVEDAAARAFSKLPAECRAGLLVANLAAVNAPTSKKPTVRKPKGKK